MTHGSHERELHRSRSLSPLCYQDRIEVTEKSFCAVEILVALHENIGEVSTNTIRREPRGIVSVDISFQCYTLTKNYFLYLGDS